MRNVMFHFQKFGSILYEIISNVLDFRISSSAWIITLLDE